MEELIIEGLTEDDLIHLYQIVGEYKIPIADSDSYKRVKELHSKLDQIITYLNTTPQSDSV